jgi:RND family efflux transporter MFP subunit
MIRQELEDATTALTTLSTDYRSLESSLAALEKRRGKQVTDLEERLAEIAARQGHTELTIASIDADMDRIRRQMGIGRSVRAPFSGVITRRYVNAGSSVHVDQPLVMITDDSQRFIRFSASEEDALSLEEGMTVEFVPTITRSEPPMVLLSLEGTPALERTRATISRIAQAVDPTTRTIQVEAEIDPGAGNNPLLTHMRVLVSLPLSHDPALVTIPERALEQSLGDHIVWTLNPKGDPEARSVLVKFLQGGKAYIERGLYAGERVIVRSAEPPKRGWKLLSHWLPHATVDASHALQSPSLLSPPARWTIARTVERLRARQTSTLQGGEE